MVKSSQRKLNAGRLFCEANVDDYSATRSWRRHSSLSPVSPRRRTYEHTTAVLIPSIANGVCSQRMRTGNIGSLYFAYRLVHYGMHTSECKHDEIGSETGVEHSCDKSVRVQDVLNRSPRRNYGAIKFVCRKLRHFVLI